MLVDDGKVTKYRINWTFQCAIRRSLMKNHNFFPLIPFFLLLGRWWMGNAGWGRTLKMLRAWKTPKWNNNLLLFFSVFWFSLISLTFLSSCEWALNLFFIHVYINLYVISSHMPMMRSEREKPFAVRWEVCCWVGKEQGRIYELIRHTYKIHNNLLSGVVSFIFHPYCHFTHFLGNFLIFA